LRSTTCRSLSRLDVAASAAAVRSEAEDEQRSREHSAAAALNAQSGGPEGVSAARIIRPGAPFKFGRRCQLVGLTASLADGLIEQYGNWLMSEPPGCRSRFDDLVLPKVLERYPTDASSRRHLPRRNDSSVRTSPSRSWSLGGAQKAHPLRLEKRLRRPAKVLRSLPRQSTRGAHYAGAGF
jgi:hypothetical protein